MQRIIISKEFLETNKPFLDEKKQQTTYKIEYITKYVEKWLYVMSNVPNIYNINFIDCMCNAGIYQDGDFGSSMRVLELFNQFADEHTDKRFNLILNDYDENRVLIIGEIIKIIGTRSNVFYYINCNDVNDFLQNEDYLKKFFNCYPKRSANLLFVDPYNFCTVKISVLNRFLQSHYCELLFNVFTSDFVRNSDKEKMRTYCKEEGIPLQPKEDLIKYIKASLRVGQIRYTFNYEFRTKTNNEIYQILFFTPNAKGLEKLKDALWDTFQGKEFHQNCVQTDAVQLSLFTLEEDTHMYAQYYALEAKDILCTAFGGHISTYQEIELFIIENTLLKESQIIEHILRPLIKENRIVKLNDVKKNNYKQDRYQFN